MTTEAGKRLLAALREHAPWFLGGSAEVEAAYIAAIEAEAWANGHRETLEAEREYAERRVAEAVAAERARIAEAVRQVDWLHVDDWKIEAAVLAIIEEKP